MPQTLPLKANQKLCRDLSLGTMCLVLSLQLGVRL